jgi:hypothetical protein
MITPCSMIIPFLILSSLCLSVCEAIVESNSYSVKGKITRVRREKHLDHLDSDSLAYYLDEYPGHDVAIMFYATWDQYSHALAPYWARKFYSFFHFMINFLKLYVGWNGSHTPSVFFVVSL